MVEETNNMPNAERVRNVDVRPGSQERSAQPPIRVFERRGQFAGLLEKGEKPRTSLAMLHAIERYLGTVFEKQGKVPNLSSEAAVSSAWATLSAINELITSIPNYIKEEMPGYFGLPRERQKLADIEQAVLELVDRIDICFYKLEDVRALIRRAARGNQEVRDRSDQNRLVQLVASRIYSLVPLVTLAPLLALGAGEVAAAGNEEYPDRNRDVPTYDIDFAGVTADTNEYSARTFRPELAEIRSIEDHISNLEFALDIALGNEELIRATISPPVNFLETADNLMPREQEQQTLPTADLIEMNLSPETSWALVEAIANGQELPADRSQIPSNIIPAEGIAINLPNSITEADIVGFFGSEPNSSGFVNAMVGQQNWINRFNQGGADGAAGHLSIPAYPNPDGTLTITSVVNVTSPLRDGVIEFPAGSLYYNPTTYLANLGEARANYGVQSDTRVARVTAEVQQQLAGYDVAAELDSFVMMEVSRETGTPVSIAAENTRFSFLNYRAESSSRVNLRRDPSLNADILAQSTTYDLIISGPLNYQEIVGVDQNGAPLLPLRNLEAGKSDGVYFDVDGIMKYVDERGEEWVAARFVDGNGQQQQGWVSTSVVELVATPTPNNVPPESPVTVIQATLQPTVPVEPTLEPNLGPTLTPQPLPGQPGAATPTPNPEGLAVADASAALANELSLASAAALPQGVANAEIFNSFVVGHYEFDTVGVYRYRWENGAWIDQNPGRTEYEGDLPGGDPRLLFATFGPQLVGWDQANFAYRRTDGALFIPAMGVEADTNRSFDQSDLENGWANQSEILQSSDFVEGVSGRRIRIFFAENHPQVRGIGMSDIVNNSPNFQAAIDAYLSNFFTEERPYIQPGDTADFVIMADDVTSGRETPIRDNRMVSISVNNIAIGNIVYESAHRLVGRISIRPSSFISENMQYFFLDVQASIVQALDRQAFGTRLAITEVKPAEFLEDASTDMLTALNDDSVEAGYQLWSTQLK